MKIHENGLIVITILATSILLFLMSAFGDQEFSGMPMNATVSQPICIVLSGNLSQGIFFTNTTSVGTQYAITNVNVENNATGNYYGPSSATVYNVTACAGNTINASIYQSACTDLMNGTNYINLTFDAGDSGQGGFFGNSSDSGTAPALSATTGFAFTVDSYRMIGERIWPGGSNTSVYMRYWLDPWPNNAPTGIYNTTYKIRAVETATSPGSGAC